MGLFKPAWMSDDWKKEDKAIKEVEKENDQVKLSEIAKYAPSEKVCEAAVEKLTDQSALADIAKGDELPDSRSIFVKDDIRVSAVKKMTDQSALTDVVKNAKHISVRMAALERLTDQSTLAYFAKSSDYSAALRMASAEKLTDQSLVQEVYVDFARDNNLPDDLRESAIKKLTNPSLLQKVYVMPFINAESLVKILEAEHPNQFDWDYLRYVQKYKTDEIAWRACAKIELPDYDKRRIYELFHYVDGDLFKTPCEAGGHQWEKTGSRSEGPEQDDSDRRTRLFYQYKCSVCGTEKEESQGLY